VRNETRHHPALSDSTIVRSPLNIHVLDGATEIGNLDLSCLPAVVRLLAQRGNILVADYDDDARRIVFYEQLEWLPAGWAAADIATSNRWAPTNMAMLNIRRRKRAIELRARQIRRTRLAKDAKRVIDLVRATGIGKRQGVVMLVFDPAEGNVAGYITVDPIMAALALVEYLEQEYPSARRTSHISRRSKGK
jgi:hypothetical protein